MTQQNIKAVLKAAILTKFVSSAPCKVQNQNLFSYTTLTPRNCHQFVEFLTLDSRNVEELSFDVELFWHVI